MLHLRWITDIHNPAEDGPAVDGASDMRDTRSIIQNNLADFTKAALRDKPALVINTGDDIRTTVQLEPDAKLHREFQDIWSPIKGMSIRLPGNHDVAKFNAGDLSRQFGFQSGTTVQSFPEATVIAWDADPTPFKEDKKTYYVAHQRDLDALAYALESARADKPVLLFSHVPIHSTSYENPLDEAEHLNPRKSHYSNQDDIYALIEKRDLRVLTFSGHRHYRNVIQRSGNIKHHCMDRFYRSVSKGERIAGFHTADITLDGKEIELAYLGAKPQRIRYFF